MSISRRAVIGGSLTAITVPGFARSQLSEFFPDPIVELRQYKIVHGLRDRFIDLFEKELVQPQEDLGMRIAGRFRDEEDPDRFVWIREFPTMAGRAAQLTAFYKGPAWQANKATANPMLDDNDNVLLLKPSVAGSGFGSQVPKIPGRTVFVNIHYLWKAPEEQFQTFFEGQARTFLADFGLHVLGSFVPDNRPNEYPHLFVRQHEKVFVWFATTAPGVRYEDAIAAVRGRSGVSRGSQTLTPSYEERPAQVLKLTPTPLSRL